MKILDLLRQNNMSWCQVAIVNHEPLDTTSHEPDPQYDTILRVLDIENELIKKHLIISQGIDQSILVPNRSDAMRIMFDGPKPRNVRQCFCINDQKRGWGLRLGYMGRQGQNREISPVKPPQGKPRMKTDIESQIAFQKETLSQLERERNSFENEFRQIEESLSRCSQTITARKRDFEKLRITLQRAEQRVDDLNAELDSFNVEDGRLDGLRQSLAEVEQEKKIVEESYGNMALEKDNLNKKSAEKKRELTAVKERLEEHEIKLRKIQQKRKSLDHVRKLALTEKNLAITQIEELRQEKERTIRKYEQQAAHVADFITQASKVCDRIPVDPGNTPAVLDAKLNKLNQQLRTYQKKQGGTDQEIHDAALEAERVYEAAKATRQELFELLALLKQSFLNRVKMFRVFQQFISARSRINFNYLLSERAFRGKLTIDHIRKKLDVHVEPDETAKGSKGRQTKTLSGGEKSFSSICLLLSLWEAMGAPLRCLDEFDVFMDDVNRDVSTRMIVSGSSGRSPNLYSQFTDQRCSTVGWEAIHLNHSKGTRGWCTSSRRCENNQVNHYSLNTKLD
jgi:chromosome segregation ATPase